MVRPVNITDCACFLTGIRMSGLVPICRMKINSPTMPNA